MFKILKRYTDEKDPDMGSVGDKAYETLSKAECLEMLKNHGIDGLELCRMGNINPLPECLCKLTFFAGQVCPVAGDSGSVESAKAAEPPKKKAKRVETPTVSSF